MDKGLFATIIEAAEEVHHFLGPGLLETVYESALSHELSIRGLGNQRQLPVPVLYKNTVVRKPLFLDILVDNKVIIEVKASGIDYPSYQAQVFTYLRFMNIKWGILINFGKQHLQDGIAQVTNPSFAM